MSGVAATVGVAERDPSGNGPKLKRVKQRLTSRGATADDTSMAAISAQAFIRHQSQRSTCRDGTLDVLMSVVIHIGYRDEHVSRCDFS